jgi:hypothetical protein
MIHEFLKFGHKTLRLQSSLFDYRLRYLVLYRSSAL